MSSGGAPEAGGDLAARESAARVARATRRWEEWLAVRPRAAAISTLIREVVRSQGRDSSQPRRRWRSILIVIAVFPAITALVSIFGLVFDPKDLGGALGDVGTEHEGSIGQALTTQIVTLTSAPATSLSIGLIVSVALSLWSASNGTYNLLRAIRLSYRLPPLGYVRARYRGVVSAFVAILGLGVVAFLSAGIGAVNDQLPGWAQIMLSILLVPFNFVLTLCLVALVYRYGAARRIGFKALLPGAALATLGLFALLYVLAWVLSSFGGDSAVCRVAAGAVGASSVCT